MADCTESAEETNGPKPPIIMKFDAAPDESSENSANEETEAKSNDDKTRTPPSPSSKSATKIHSPVLTASKFGNSFGINEFSKSSSVTTAIPTTAFGSILKPSSLLRPSPLSLLTTANLPSTSSNSTTIVAQSDSNTKNPFTTKTNSAIHDGNSEEVKKNEDKTEEPPKFLPLGSSSHENSVNSTVTAPNVSSTPSFVFGQNLKERVTVANDNGNNSKDESDNKEEDKSEEITPTNENGASELLFSSAATVCRTTSRPGITLTQAAQEIEEANRANKRKYNEVTSLTGEEGETNVLQINCKLFAYDKATSSWQERGRGTLRLNDRDEESRLVGRASGTQRLILNTKIWPGMTVELAGPKSLRLTAMDIHGELRIFIVQAAPTEVDELHKLLKQRLKRPKERQPKKRATEH